MGQMIFTKYSAERSREFAIRTDIVKENTGELAVEKHNLYPEGQRHVQKLFQWYGKLQQEYSPEQFGINKCQKLPDGVRLEYLKGETLQEKLEQLKEKGQEEKILEYVEQYLTRMAGGTANIPFSMTPEFVRVFGEPELPEHLNCRQVTNIDMIFSNILIEDGEWSVIDYEWTFDFPIPLNFVLYRAFFLIASELPGVECLDVTRMMGRLGIGSKEQQAYDAMEHQFQEYVRGSEKPVRDIIKDIGYDAISMSRVEQAFGAGESAGVFLKGRNGQSPWRDMTKNASIRSTGAGTVRVSCPVTGDLQELELRLTMGSGLIQVKRLLVTDEAGQTQEERTDQLAMNGMKLGDGLYVVMAEETRIKLPVGQCGKLEIFFQAQELPIGLNQVFVKQLNRLYGQRTLLEQENQHWRKRYGSIDGSIFMRSLEKLWKSGKNFRSKQRNGENGK